MANKQQISFLLAFLAAAMIVLATADQSAPSIPADGEEKTLADLINEMIAETQRAKAKVVVLGNSRMVHDCDKAYGTSLDFLNKAIELTKEPGSANIEEVKKNVREALKAYESCDYSYAESTRPTPFIANNAELKILANKCLGKQ